MGMDISTYTVVGCSFYKLIEDEALNWDQVENLEKAAEEVGLETVMDMYAPEKVSDVFIGVLFRNRPTDAEVEAATLKVSEHLPKIEKFIGAEADSDVAVWTATEISV